LLAQKKEMDQKDIIAKLIKEAKKAKEHRIEK
jgi:hypothetical protein